MKKFFLGLLFLLPLLIIGSVNAFDFSFGMDNILKQLMQQGNHIVCLDAETKQINVPSDWKKPALGTVKLSGAECKSPSGCKILRCNSSNSEIAVNEHLLNICKTHPENWAGCSKEGKTEEVEEKTAISKQVKPGCEEVKNYATLSMADKESDVLGTETGFLPQGPVDVELDDSYVVHVDYEYFLSQPDEGTLVELGQGGEAITPGSENTQQLGTIEFSFTEEEIEGSIKDCDVISWDPFGRVFDSESLEPMSDVNVTLIDDKTDKPAVMRFNPNFDVTDLRGLFNIQVENEGLFRLEVDKPLTHMFADSAKINPKYVNIYSDIYKKDAVFEEKAGVPTHHDIPLQPIGEPYHGAVAQLIEGTLESHISGNYAVYSGMTTYPFSKVCLVGAETNKTVGKCVNADKIGKYSMSVHKKKVPMEFLEVSIKKVDLNNINNVYPLEYREKGIGYEPVLSYIEGYAYDEDGNRLFNTKVNVRLTSDDKIFYETTTDDSGRYIIYKKDLPFIEYYLEYVNPQSQKTIKKTTSDFISDNKSFIDSEKMDLILGAKDNQPIINPVTGELNKIEDRQREIIDTKTNLLNTNYRLYLIIIILFVLAVAVVILIKVAFPLTK